MLNLTEAILLAEMRQEEYEQRAEMYRLYREARGQTPTFLHQLLAWLGHRMVIVGESMQRPALKPYPSRVNACC